MTPPPNGTSSGTNHGKTRGSLRATFRGIGLIARARAEGLNCFGDSNKAVIASLAPGAGLMAATLVEGIIDGDGERALGAVLAPFCVLLAPSVLSFELARLWGREAFWPRYIVAFNWCQWLVPAVLVVLVTGLTLLSSGGPSAGGGAGRSKLALVMLVVFFYALWINWFLVRHALALTVSRAIGFVALINLGVALVIFIPLRLVTAFQ